MVLSVLGNIVIFILLLAVLYVMQAKHVAFTRRVIAGLVLGIIFGAALQLVYGRGDVITNTLSYIDIVGSGYVRLLRMIIIPLIMVSIICAILKLKDGTSLGKVSVLTIGILLITTMIAALIGILAAHWYGLTTIGLHQGQAEIARLATLEERVNTVKDLSFAKLILDFIPIYPVADMAGLRKTSTIAVVIFSAFIGVAAIGVARKKPEHFNAFAGFMDVIHTIVMRMITLVLRLTPFGVMALIANVVADSDYADILNLFKFVLASYTALIMMFIIHLIIIALSGLNPFRFLKKIIPVLTFAFISRTSAGAIPLNIQTQTQTLGNSEGVANFSASFGTTIGQNGCAGIYPAMLAVMVAPSMGIDPFTLSFILPLLLIICVSSFGVAGVGGGATYAALIVLSVLNFPIEVASLLISIEPLIDMGRTALNVSGSLVAGTVTSRLLHQHDIKVFNADNTLDMADDEHSV